jgi:hypothetical protein
MLTSLTVTLFACQSPANHVRPFKDSALIAAWAQDSLGCLRFRNEKVAAKLMNDNHLANQSKAQFLQVFHLPDTTYENDGWEILVYYWGAVCQKGMLAPNSDKCYVKFYFKSNKLTFMEVPCE